ncbi:MAG: hypothetical protein HRT92_05105 [Piscirickettsiaceae bacterium]|nr:hypothetical protein [Piscirickettsiaceae bacterium]
MKPLKKLLADNEKLIHSTMQKVESHVQRQVGKWIQNTVLLNGYDVPFKYKRQKKYKSLKGARVNLIYYAGTEQIAGMEFEVMNVIKINLS